MDINEIMRQVGENLTRVRLSKGFTIPALSVLASVDEEVISGIEEGKLDFPLKVLFRLAQILNVDFRQILIPAKEE